MRHSTFVASSVALAVLLAAGETHGRERYRLVVDLNGTFCRSFDDAKVGAHAALVRQQVVNAKISEKAGVGRCFFASFTVGVDEVGDAGVHLVDGVSFKFYTFPLNKMTVWSWKQIPTEAL